MKVNKYLLILLGFIISIILNATAPLIFGIIWAIAFWVWYFSLKDVEEHEDDK